MREHLLQIGEQMSKQGLEGPEELILPEFPEAFSVVWSKFIELSSSRSQGFDGPMPISYADMYYWSKMTGWKLSKMEVAVVRKLDALWLKAVRD